MLRTKTLGLIGAGNMGQALLRGVVHGDHMGRERILASARTETTAKRVEELLGVRTTRDNGAVVAFSDVVVLAVKPQDFPGTLAPLCALFHERQLVLSIAAGISTSWIEDTIGLDLPVIRSMPNTPALVGQGASAYCRGRYATSEHALIAQQILGSVGVAVEVEESAMDAVTAVSGTGPAYFYYAMEAMVAAAEKVGLERDLARRLVKQTLLGAARLVMDSGEEPAQLRARVTSRGGTTAAAVAQFERDEFFAVFSRAVEAACKRSGELGREASAKRD